MEPSVRDRISHSQPVCRPDIPRWDRTPADSQRRDPLPLPEVNCGTAETIAPDSGPFRILSDNVGRQNRNGIHFYLGPAF